MKKLLLLSLFAIFAVAFSVQAEKIRVATAGDSLTGAKNDFGFYGAPLAEMLGEDYQVFKFGRGGSGVFRKMREDGTTEKSPEEYKWAYFNSPEAAALMEFQPHIIVMSIGANDAKRENFEKLYNAEIWKQDYMDIIKKFQTLPTNPRIFIAIPPKMFYEKGGIMGAFDDDVAVQYMHPALKEIAAEMDGVTLIDFYTPMEGKKDFFPGGMDWVHPDHRGHYIMAKTAYEAIMGHPFTVISGGSEIDMKNIELDLYGKNKVKNGVIEKAAAGSAISFNYEFGSVASYDMVEVQTKKNRTTDGSFDFYLDDESVPFASISTDGLTKTYTALSATFDRKIVGQHKVTVKWNGQDCGLKSIAIKEKLVPFVNDDYNQKFYIVNKATGKVLDTDAEAKSVFLSDYAPGKTTQQFLIEHYTYNMYFIRNIDEKLHVQVNDNKVILGKIGDNWRSNDPKYCIYIRPTEDGSFTLELSPEKKMGWNGSKLVGNGSQATDDFEWEIVKAEDMGK